MSRKEGKREGVKPKEIDGKKYRFYRKFHDNTTSGTPQRDELTYDETMERLRNNYKVPEMCDLEAGVQTAFARYWMEEVNE